MQASEAIKGMQKRGMSYGAIADALGVRVSTITRIARGQSTPRPALRDALANLWMKTLARQPFSTGEK